MYAGMHTSIHPFINPSIHTYIHRCAYIYCTRTFTFTFTYTCTYTCTYTYTHTYTQNYTHIDVYAHIHKTYTHKCFPHTLPDDNMYRAVLKSLWPYTNTRMAGVERVQGEQKTHSYERYMAYDLARRREALLLLEIVQTGQ